jgi:hypothetical protein
MWTPGEGRRTGIEREQEWIVRPIELFKLTVETVFYI